MTSYRYYWLFMVVGVATLLAFQPHWSEWRHEERLERIPPDPTLADGSRLAVHGLELVSVDNGRLALGLDADVFWVRPREFLFSGVTVEKELYVEGAHLRLHLTADEPGPAPVTGLSIPGTPLPLPAAPGGAASPLLDGIGLAQVLGGFAELDGVSHLSVRGIDIEVFRGPRRVATLNAETGVSDATTGGVRFANVRIEHTASGKVLFAPVAVWGGYGGHLVIPEGYREVGPLGPVQGDPASLDIDFTLVPL